METNDKEGIEAKREKLSNWYDKIIKALNDYRKLPESQETPLLCNWLANRFGLPTNRVEHQIPCFQDLKNNWHKRKRLSYRDSDEWMIVGEKEERRQFLRELSILIKAEQLATY